MSDTELIDAALAGPAYGPLPVVKYGASQRVEIDLTSRQSDPIDARLVTITPTTDCFYAVGDDPIAADAAGSDYLPAGKKFSISLTPGQRIAVISADGDLGGLFILPALAAVV
jgi:hypothetical protein